MNSSPDVPPVKECPCGNGYAERLSTPTVEPNSKNGKEQVTTFHYKHEGCSIGGSIVLVDGELERMVGPLFNPGRYGVIESLTTSAAATSVALSDGGEPIDEEGSI